MNPISDLVQYIISDVPTEVRRVHEMDILRAYWIRLIEKGVNAEEFTWERCIELYKNGLDRWLWLYPLLAFYKYVPEYFHSQIDGFLQDHSPDATSFPIISVVEIFDQIIPYPKEQ